MIVSNALSSYLMLRTPRANSSELLKETQRSGRSNNVIRIDDKET